jgi:hypothetical protein
MRIKDLANRVTMGSIPKLLDIWKFAVSNGYTLDAVVNDLEPSDSAVGAGSGWGDDEPDEVDPDFD